MILLSNAEYKPGGSCKEPHFGLWVRLMSIGSDTRRGPDGRTGALGPGRHQGPPDSLLCFSLPSPGRVSPGVRRTGPVTTVRSRRLPPVPVCPFEDTPFRLLTSTSTKLCVVSRVPKSLVGLSLSLVGVLDYRRSPVFVKYSSILTLFVGSLTFPEVGSYRQQDLSGGVHVERRDQREGGGALGCRFPGDREGNFVKEIRGDHSTTQHLSCRL